MSGDEDGSWLAFEAELLRYDPAEWLVMTGNRLLVAAIGFVLLGALLGGVVASGLAPLERETPVLFVLFSLVAANFTLIAIVTSLSTFVLGRRLETPGDVRQKIDDTIDYREAVGASIGARVTPVQPDVFFLTLYRQARLELDALAELELEGRTYESREILSALVTDLGDHCDYVVDVLQHPSSGLKHALFVSLGADYENAVGRAWHLQWERSDEFTDEAAAPLGRLADILQHLEVASRVFKTVFIESEVADLSRYLLYVGFPAQLAAVTLMLAFTAPGAGPPFSLSLLRVLAPLVVAAGFAPFLLLGSYVVRLTVVAGRTTDTFPFSSRFSTTGAVRDDRG
ncbi:MAG: hypothetical protein ABEJ43_03955 [Haloferacaceae archaeon]